MGFVLPFVVRNPKINEKLTTDASKNSKEIRISQTGAFHKKTKTIELMKWMKNNEYLFQVIFLKISPSGISETRCF